MFGFVGSCTFLITELQSFGRMSTTGPYHNVVVQTFFLFLTGCWCSADAVHNDNIELQYFEKKEKYKKTDETKSRMRENSLLVM